MLKTLSHPKPNARSQGGADIGPRVGLDSWGRTGMRHKKDTFFFCFFSSSQYPFKSGSLVILIPIIRKELAVL